MKGYTYILKCFDNSYYTGSTKNLGLRLCQHQNGEGANYTSKRLPVELVYFEEYSRIDEAFYREKQIQKWSRAKKKALIEGNYDKLHDLAECKNTTRSLRIRSLRLRSGNGELRSGNGEFRSGNGEFRSGNGELRSGDEELCSGDA